jgi:hypothetical protein
MMKEACFDIVQAFACSFVAGWIPGFVIGFLNPEMNPLTVPYMLMHQVAAGLAFIVLMIPVSLWRQKRRTGEQPPRVLHLLTYSIGTAAAIFVFMSAVLLLGGQEL